MSTTTAPLTVEEFLALAESSDQRRELIGGEVFSTSYGKRRHELVKSNINRLLLTWLLQNRTGLVLVETGFRFDEQTLAIPDLSFFSRNPGQAGVRDISGRRPMWPAKLFRQNQRRSFRGKSPFT